MSSSARRRPARNAVAIGAAIAVALAATSAAIAPAAAPTRTLTVTTSGDGIVRSDDGRIACRPRCDRAYRRGRVVTLSAVPSRHFAFDRWSRGCAGSAPTCLVALDAPSTVAAVFARSDGDLDVTVGGSGVVTSQTSGISCGRATDVTRGCHGTFGQGTTVGLVATPTAGAVFVGWQGACRAERSATCDVTIEAATEVSATFRGAAPAPGPQTLTVEGPIVSSPAIACPTSCSVQLASGTAATLRNESNQGWAEGACFGAAPSCTVIVDGPTLVVSIPVVQGPFTNAFVKVTVTGRGTVRGPGFACKQPRPRRSACERSFGTRARLTLQARPAKGWQFAGWNPRGFCAPEARRCRLTVGTGKSVAVLFQKTR